MGAFNDGHGRFSPVQGGPFEGDADGSVRDFIWPRGPTSLLAALSR